MKKTLAALLIALGLAGQAEAICIFGWGNTCEKQDITNTATNQLKVGDVTSNTSTTIGDTSVTQGDQNVAFETKDIITIKNFSELVEQNAKSTEILIKDNTEKFAQILELYKLQQEVLAKQNKEWQDIVERVTASPPTIPVISSSSSFPISIYQNSLSTPLYIKDTDSTINTQTLANSLTNMSIPLPSGGSGESTAKGITQTAHGFVVGDWVYLSGASTYAKADADLAASSDTVGVVTTVADANTFTLTTEGYVTGLSGLTAATRYYLSTTAGAITSTAPDSNIKAVFIADTTTSGYVQQYAVVGSSQALTYGRVKANANLASIAYSITSPGTAINFDSTLYSSGMTFSGTNGITPSVAGRYRASFFAMAGSGDFNGDGTFHIVQNGVSLGSIFVDIMQAAGVNQIAPFIDVDLAAGQAVTLNYQPAVADAVPWGQGSYFQLTQLPTAVAPVVDTVAEFGQPTMTNGVTISSATFADFSTNQAFTVPSAGTWEIGYLAFISASAENNSISTQLVDVTNGNTVVPNTQARNVRGSTSGTGMTMVAKTYVTTTAATTYKLQGAISAGTGTLTTGTTAGPTGGSSAFTYKKISGFLPSTGSTVDYVQVKLNGNNVSPAAGGAIVFDNVVSGNIPYAAGVFTLTAGKTYKLTGIAVGATINSFQWRDITNNALIGAAGTSIAVDVGVGTSGNVVAEAFITPATNITVRLESITATTYFGLAAVNAGQTQASIVEIRSSPNTVGTLPANDQSAAGYFDIGNMRIQWGLHNDGNVDTTTVTLPAAFLNSTYSVVATSNTSAGSLAAENKTTTTFDIDRASTTTTTQDYSWIAFGFKP